MVDTYETIEIKRCTCRFCNNTFTKTDTHFSVEFCSVDCLDEFTKNTIAESWLFIGILKMSFTEL